MARKQDLDWSFGLKAAHGGYLTVENFGNKLNAAAGVMKKKQIMFLEKTEGKDEIKLRTHKGGYLRCDGDGQFLADGDESNADECFWNIEAQADGRWALKNTKYGWYAGAAGKEIEGAKQCFEAEVSESKLFTVKLAMHPMVTLRNVKRTTYVHATKGPGAADFNQFETDEIIPWGDDAVIMLISNDDNGTYSIMAHNGKVLKSTGMLVDAREGDGSTDYVIEFHGGVVAFKNKKEDRYVTSLGGNGLAKASKSSITRDEQYEMENSYPQVTLQSFNKKFISCKQGIELAASVASANSDQEIFQFEPLDNGNWTVTAATTGCHEPESWSVSDDGGVSSSSAASGSKEFSIEFFGPQVAFKAANGKYITQQKNGYLKANGSDPTGESLFAFTIVNRPRLVLRGNYGFVGTLPSGLLECNKSDFEVFTLETAAEGISIKDSKDKYWAVTDTGIAAAGDVPEFYHVELHKNSKMTISHGGRLFQGAQNGAFTATGAAADANSLFEY